jgi:hypothetical protein
MLRLAACLICSLQRQHLTGGGKDDGEKRRERQMTVTMLGTTITYCLLSLPFMLHTIVMVFDRGYAVSGPLADPQRYYMFKFVQVSACVIKPG